jgi:hypothetical protein
MGYSNSLLLTKQQIGNASACDVKSRPVKANIQIIANVKKRPITSKNRSETG